MVEPFYESTMKFMSKFLFSMEGLDLLIFIQLLNLCKESKHAKSILKLSVYENKDNYDLVNMFKKWHLRFCSVICQR